MEIITATKLQAMSETNKRRFEELLPALVKKLIISGCPDITKIRIPGNNDIWAPGFDGIVECSVSSRFVKEGLSVWEFGNSADSLKKINNDYNKRTNNPLGIDKNQSSFYLVIPKIWSYKKTITAWENEHNDWAKVSVYDAVVLCDWINSEPQVCAWLFEELFQEKLHFSTVKTAWEVFSNKTNPPLTKLYFLSDRENEKELFLESLNSPIVKIKGDTTLDAVGFALAALKEDKYYSETCIVINDYQTYEKLTDIAENKLFLLNFDYKGDIKPGNTVILCFNKTAVSIIENVSVKQLYRNHYDKAFRDMGIAEGKINELYSFTHGNLRAIVRRIPGNSIDPKPEWIKEKNIESIIPLLFVRSFNADKDFALIEMLAGGTAKSDIQRHYESLLKIEDSPIKKVHNNYIIVNYEEAWDAFGLNTFEEHFNTLSNTIYYILNEINSNGVWNGYYPNQLHGIFNDLVINYIYYSHTCDNNKMINAVVTRILSFLDGNKSSDLVLNCLRNLAEASPDAVMSFINQDIDSKSGIIESIFNDTYRNDYVNILHALEELALYDETNINACKVLYTIYCWDAVYRLSNSPKESLLSILCLWNKTGSLLLKQKVEIVKAFFSINPIKGGYFIIDLIAVDHIFVSNRIGKEALSTNESITWQEIYTGFELLADLVFEYAFNKKEFDFLIGLLKEYGHFRPLYLKKWIPLFDKKSFSDNQLFELNYYLRCQRYNIKKFNWENKYNYIDIIDQWIINTDLDDKILQYSWMFHDYYELPSEQLSGIEDYKEVESIAYEVRCETIKKLLTQNSIDDLVIITKHMNNDKCWGAFLSDLKLFCSSEALLNTLLDDKKYHLLAGYIDKSDLDVAKKIYLSLDRQLQLLILKLLNRRDIDEWLDDEQARLAYWGNKNMFSYDQKMYEQLLVYNPFGLLHYCTTKLTNDIQTNMPLIIEIMHAISLYTNDMDIYRQNKYYLEEIINKVDDFYYSTEWVMICICLFEKNIIGFISVGMTKYFFYNPNCLIEKQQHNRNYYFAFYNSYALPECAYNNYTDFKFFFDTISKAGEIGIAGNILGRCKNGDDGYYFHEYARIYLEEINSEKFDIEVLVGKVNSSNMRSITDGTNMRNKADALLKASHKLSLLYPHASKIISNIANQYLGEADMDWVYSETGRW